MRPGDVVDYHGELHRISRIEHRDGWSWQIACDDEGWAIAVSPDGVVAHDDTEPPSPP
jgi:hypothetical protein